MFELTPIVIKRLTLFIFLILLSCSKDSSPIPDAVEPTPTDNFQSTLELYSEFTDISEANVSTKGPFAIWWDKRYSIEYKNSILEMLLTSRNKIINELGFLDPVNIENGKFINIYLHQTGNPDIFDKYNWNASARGGIWSICDNALWNIS